MKKMTPPERIEKMVEHLNTTIDDFGKKINNGRSQSVYDVINGKTKSITDNMLKKIEKAYPNEFNHIWLLTGTGEMLNSSDSVIQQGQGNINNDYSVRGNKNRIEQTNVELLEIIKKKDEQIAEKDKQIQTLLELLKNK